MKSEAYKLIDLFAGCGGLSRGFEWTGRFGAQFAAELVSHPAATYRANIRNIDGQPTRMFEGDLQQLAENTPLLWSELKRSGISEPGEADVLAGGPPCQGFSRNGVRLYADDDRKTRFYDDPRNHLYKAFLKVIELVRPKIVLIENVREFVNFGKGRFSSDLMIKLEELGYVADFRKLCAADFGIPQVRHRVFFVGIRRDVAARTGVGPVFPIAEFAARATQLSLINRPYRTVRDAISDLPPPSLGKTEQPLRYDSVPALGEYAKQMRNPAGVVFNHFARELSAKQRQRIRAVGAGRMKHIQKHLQTKAFYGSAYRRLSWDEPALTITTWVYHVGSGRFAHPVEDRGVTMREAARLQSFDDAFIFPALVNPVSQMIGNAVPPMLANKFASEFTRVLDSFARGVRLDALRPMRDSTSQFDHQLVLFAQEHNFIP